MHELGLKLLQVRLGALLLRQVAQEAGEVAPAGRIHLADGEMEGERRAVRPLAGSDAAEADCILRSPVVRYRSR